ncbi:MAG: hypothetical protein M9921_10260 [Fimbriimonadaceae bacterium]|nr:hypothetical protein [Chthonomonadaceae bacterium]MCO5297228.1 hypothetical protein [Fimbriimonadaceae bacterium]
MFHRPHLRRTDLLDTSDLAHRRFVELLRQLTPEQRLRMVLDRIAFGRQINEAGRKHLERHA